METAEIAQGAARAPQDDAFPISTLRDQFHALNKELDEEIGQLADRIAPILTPSDCKVGQIIDQDGSESPLTSDLRRRSSELREAIDRVRDLRMRVEL
jgi:hypothetical protein